MEHPLISFIIASYNTPKELMQECVASLVEIDVPKEIIIVDDGSEKPVECDAPHSVVYRIEHSGLSAARNHGLEKAQGKYVQFVDADDCLFSSVYVKILEHAENNNLDMVSFCFSNKKKNSKSQPPHSFNIPMMGAEYMANNNIRGAACMYLFRREVLDALRFTNGIYHEDEEFTPLLMLKAKRFVKTDVVAYFYRQHANTITTSREKEHMTKRLNDHLLVILNLQGKYNELSDILSKTALIRRINQLCMDYLYNIMRFSKSELKARVLDLKENGLFPLPLKHYTLKYYMFAVITKFI